MYKYLITFGYDIGLILIFLSLVGTEINQLVAICIFSLLRFCMGSAVLKVTMPIYSLLFITAWQSTLSRRRHFTDCANAKMKKYKEKFKESFSQRNSSKQVSYL